MNRAATYRGRAKLSEWMVIIHTAMASVFMLIFVIRMCEGRSISISDALALIGTAAFGLGHYWLKD